MYTYNDKQILRELAKQITEIAGLPVQEETRSLWRSLNGLKPKRPMLMIDQVCWNEMNFDDELTLRCEDPECQEYEKKIRKILITFLKTNVKTQFLLIY